MGHFTHGPDHLCVSMTYSILIWRVPGGCRLQSLLLQLYGKQIVSQAFHIQTAISSLYRRKRNTCTDGNNVHAQNISVCRRPSMIIYRRNILTPVHVIFLSCAGEMYLLVIVAGFYTSQRCFKTANLKIIYAISKCADAS